MAITQSIVAPSGVASTYWVTTGLQADLINQVANVILSGFLSTDAYSAGSTYLALRFYTLTNNDFANFLQSPTTDSVEQWIVANDPDFVSAAQATTADQSAPTASSIGTVVSIAPTLTVNPIKPISPAQPIISKI